MHKLCYVFFMYDSSVKLESLMVLNFQQKIFIEAPTVTFGTYLYISHKLIMQRCKSDEKCSGRSMSSKDKQGRDRS